MDQDRAVCLLGSRADERKEKSYIIIYINICILILCIFYLLFCFVFYSKRTLKTVAELKELMLSLYDTWRNKFGVLLFLYSVILTKVELIQFVICLVVFCFIFVCMMLLTMISLYTMYQLLYCVCASIFCYFLVSNVNSILFFFNEQGIENIKNEIEDTLEPFVDPVYGHGRYADPIVSSFTAIT